MYRMAPLLAGVGFQKTQRDRLVLVLRVEDELFGRRLRRRRRLAVRLLGMSAVVFASKPEFVSTKLSRLY